MEPLSYEQRRQLATLFNLLADAVFLYLAYILLRAGIFALSLPGPETAPLSPLPPWFFPGTMSLALGFNLRLGRTQRRLVNILGANLLYIVIIVFAALETMTRASATIVWPLTGLLSGQAGLAHQANLWLAVIMITLAVIRTYHKSGQNPQAAEALTRFELSAGALFGLSLLLSLLAIPLAGGILWLLAGFLANAVALSLAPSLSLSKKPLWLGPAILLVLLVPTTLSGPLILPLLSSPAGEALEAARPFLIFLKDTFLNILIRLLSWGHMVPETSSAEQTGSPPMPGAGAVAQTEPGRLESIGHFLLFAAGAILLLAVLFLLTYFLYRLYRYLFQLRKSQPDLRSLEQSTSWWRVLIHILGILGYWLRTLIRTLAWRFTPAWRTQAGALDAYRTLLYWGKRQRLPRKPFETPREYQSRLTIKFPAKANSLNIITEAYVNFAYGHPDTANTPLSVLHQAEQSLYH